MRNWQFLTGPLDRLRRLWLDYNVCDGICTVPPGGAMAAHNDLIFVLDAKGRVRTVLQADPGGSTATAASLSSLVAAEVHRVLAP